MMTRLKEFLHFFGYAIHPTIKCKTQFFQYTDQTDSDLATFKKFVKLNDILQNQSKENRPKETWEVNGGPAEQTYHEFIEAISGQDELIELRE